MTEELATQPQETQVRDANGDSNRQYVRPVVRIHELEGEWKLEAEMPGVRREDVQINTEDTELTIIGRKPDTTPADAKTHYRESYTHDYKRIFELHPSVDTSNIRARMEQGILTLTLPKSENLKPRSIEVTD